MKDFCKIKYADNNTDFHSRSTEVWVLTVTVISTVSQPSAGRNWATDDRRRRKGVGMYGGMRRGGNLGMWK